MTQIIDTIQKHINEEVWQRILVIQHSHGQYVPPFLATSICKRLLLFLKLTCTFHM